MKMSIDGNGCRRGMTAAYVQRMRPWYESCKKSPERGDRTVHSCSCVFTVPTYRRYVRKHIYSDLAFSPTQSSGSTVVRSYH